MKLGFYYHIALAAREGRLYLPGFLGLFVDALAAEVDELTLILHEASNADSAIADYELEGSNIKWVNLGAKTAAWHRSIFHRRVLKPLRQKPLDIDMLLLRSPSPLAPYFSEIEWLADRIAYMVVSDYGKGADFVPQTSIRNRLVRMYSKWNDRVFKKRLEGKLVIANSREIFDTFQSRTNRLHEVKTTTLTDGDFFEREDTCCSDVIRLLYTGRVVLDKGLRELVEAAQLLVTAGVPVEVQIVGWEEDATRPVETELRALANEFGISERLVFQGRKKVGAELNGRYRDADIYLIPSYHEGFPRTIWEAMANSLPVVATKVGSIPRYLTDGSDAVLIEPRNSDAIARAVRRLVENGDLRRGLIKRGFEMAKLNTVDRQTRKLVAILDDEIRRLD